MRAKSGIESIVVFLLARARGFLGSARAKVAIAVAVVFLSGGACGLLLSWSWNPCAAPQQGIRWHDNLHSACRLAAETNRLVLVHFWSDSCATCRRMDSDVFSRPDVAAAIEAHFVPVRIDASHIPAAARGFGVSSWPSDVVMTPQQHVLERFVGGATAVPYVSRMIQIAMTAGLPSGPPVAQIAVDPPLAPRKDPPVPSASSTPPLALDGYCPVTLAQEKRWVKGDRRWGVIHRGQTYLFCGPEEARQFYDDPESYAPVASGIDLVAAVEQDQAVPGRREHGTWYGGRVYLFASEAAQQMFDRSPERYVSAAPPAPVASTASNANRRY